LPDSLVVWVTSVETLPLSAAAERLGKQAEWPDAVLLAGMADTLALLVMEHM
jgi:hypothetical protein